MQTDIIMKAPGKEISYLDIVRRNGDIKIPLIQRDYAQGRNGKKVEEIREKFLKDLRTAIVEKKPLSLDFIYGVTDENRFIPLDGQQRLTTLFLLCIYLDGLRGKDSEDLDFRFTYETRESSRIFCEKIIAHRHEVVSEENLAERENASGEKFRMTPSAIIRNQPWWLKKWESDPTIEGMLRMLDAIDRRFYSDRKMAAANLFDQEESLITFHFMNLDHYDDPDDLFIKMNARGLPLTEFEIFKGKWMEQIEANYTVDEARKMKSLIDVHWTDFLWPMRRLRPGLTNTDPFFRNLLKLAIGDAAASLGLESADFEVLFEANRKDLIFSYGKYTDEYGVVFDRAILDRIAESLGEMCGKDTIFTRLRTGEIPSEGWLDLEKEWDYFVVQDDDVRINPNYKGRLSLYAAARFSFLMPHASDENINEWTRLMRNLLDNTRVDDVKDTVKIIKDIDTILAQLNTVPEENVNSWVAQSDFKPEGFSKSQWQEEEVKAELRKDPEWNREITEAERHDYLDGNIGAILWLAGVVGDYTPFDGAPLSRDLDLFKQYKEKCLRLFDEAGRKDSKVTADYLLVRALLTKGDYMPDLGYDRRNMYNNPGDRDYSWKSLFRIDHSTKVGALEILKQVLDDTDFDTANVEASLQAVIKHVDSAALPLWRQMMVSDRALAFLKFSRKGFLGFGQGDPENTMIYGASRRNGYHAALYPLFAEVLAKVINPEAQVSVAWNTSIYEDYTVTINGKTWGYWDNEFNRNYAKDEDYDDDSDLNTVEINSMDDMELFAKNVLEMA